MLAEINAPTTRRREILDAAAAVFAERGFHGTGMRDIADRLGMKAGSLYFHLASKDAALAEVCAAGLQSVLRAAEHAVDAGPDLASRCRALIAAQSAEFAEHGDYIIVFQQDRRQLTEDARARLAEVTREFSALLDRIFGEAVSRGELATGIDPRAARFAMIGMLRNLTQLYVEGPIRDYHRVAEQSVTIFLDGASA